MGKKGGVNSDIEVIWFNWQIKVNVTRHSERERSDTILIFIGDLLDTKIWVFSL